MNDQSNPADAIIISRTFNAPRTYGVTLSWRWR